MIRWLEKNVVAIVASLLLILQTIVVIGLLDDSTDSGMKTKELLKQANHNLNDFRKIISFEPSKYINILKKESILSILKLSSEESYCFTESGKSTLMKISPTGALKLWRFKKGSFKSLSSKSPNIIGSLFIYGNNIIAFLKDTDGSQKTSVHRFDHILLNKEGVLSGFKVDGDWIKSDSCR